MRVVPAIAALLLGLVGVAGKAIDNGLVLTPRKIFVPGKAGGKVCSAGAVDLMFIIDGSSSIGEPDFVNVKDFLINVVRGFQSEKSGSGDDPLRVAAIQFSGNPNTEFSFSTFANSSNDAVAYFQHRLTHKKGVTNTGKALIYALEKELREEKGMRAGVPKVVIVFTDGLATDDIEGPAARFHRSKAGGEATRVLAVGVGKADVNQLAVIAQSEDHPLPGCDAEAIKNDPNCLPSNVYKSSNFAELKTLVQGLVESQRRCVHTQAEPGQLVEDPDNLGIDLTCGPNGITVGSATEKPFQGRVYVKGAYDLEGCFVLGDRSTAYAGNLTFGFLDCGTRRRRQLEPRGITIEATVVFQFHESVQTKIDIPFHVRCFYMETRKEVDVGVSVATLSTQAQQFDLPMPVCSYRVVSSYEDNDGNPVVGEEVRFAQVGDKITHLWECRTDYPEFFKMRVHDCETTTSPAVTAQLIDENGCGIDDILVTTPQYNSQVLTAWVDTHVFKFADKEVISFQCQVSICVDNPNGVEDTDGELLCENYPPNRLCEGLPPIPGSNDVTDVIEEDREGGAQYNNGDYGDYADSPPSSFSRPSSASDRRLRGKRQSRRFFHIPAHQVKFKKDHTMDVGVDDLFVADKTELDLDRLAADRRGLRESRSEASQPQRKVCLTHTEAILFAALSLGGFVVTAAITVAVHVRNPNEKLPF